MSRAPSPRTSKLLTVLALGALAACGGDDDPQSPDVGADASQDVAPIDTGGDIALDTDGGTADADPADTDPADADTGQPDTADADTGEPDADADTGVADADADAADADAGVIPVERYTPEVVTCGGGTLLAPPTGTCAVDAGDARLRIRGTVLTPDAVYEGGDVVVEANGYISCVGCGCGDDAEGATVVRCAEGLISPALINANDHAGWSHLAPLDWGDERFDHIEDWRLGSDGHTHITDGIVSDTSPGAATWTQLRHILAGTTATVGGLSGTGLVRNLDRGSRSGLTGPPVDRESFPLRSSGFTPITADCAYPSVPDDDEFGPGAPSIRLASGITAGARNELLCLLSDDRGGNDLLDQSFTLFHTLAVTGDDAVALAERGTSVTWSPRSSIALYGDTTPVTLLDTAGVNIGLGTDWSLTGSADMLRELACASEFSEERLDGWFNAYDLWAMATLGNAAAAGADTEIGVLAAGRLADIAIFRADGGEVFADLVDSTPADVVLTLRGGTVLAGDADVVAALPDSTQCETLGAAAGCVEGKAICLVRETGYTFAGLDAELGDAYGIAFCGAPDDEPACDPFRDGEYGAPTATDADGDGVDDDADNCPSVFNPIRPLDDGEQADADDDGEGDACDPCPTEAGDDCTPPNPRDRDGDGVWNHVDNCPDDANPEQPDADSDGIGDVCDACPDESNADGRACTLPIYELKQTTELGQIVGFEGIVTAVGDDRFFVQHALDQHDGVNNYQYSGIYVFTVPGGTAFPALPEAGDRVRLQGTLGNFFGQRQITDAHDLEVISVDNPLPDAQVLGVDDLDTDLEAAAWEGVLVRLNDVTVTDDDPPVGGGDSAPTYEFEVGGAVIVNDLFYRVDPTPSVSTVLYLTGVVRRAPDRHKLEPRSAADVVIDL